MTGNVSHNLGEFSVDQPRNSVHGARNSTTIKSQSVKKRNQMNRTFMRQQTGDLNDLTQDSIG